MKTNSLLPVAVVYDRRISVPGSTRAPACPHRRPRRWIPAIVSFVFLAFLVAIPSFAQIQQAWVARYNNGVTNGTHQAVKMALDASGNIYITGFSQNTNGNLGYATSKYAPNGNQLWAARYDSTNFPSARPVGLVLDTNGDIFVTGTALTVKYNANGNQLWTAPYAGTSLAVSDTTNIVVTGYGTNFNTVKLSGAGSNIWTLTYADNQGATLSQVVLVDGAGNVYVSGQDNFTTQGGIFYQQLRIVKCDGNANQLWTTTPFVRVPQNGIEVVGAALDSFGNLYVEWNSFSDNPYQYETMKFSSSNGNLALAVYDPTGVQGSQAKALALDFLNNAFVTGLNDYYYPNVSYGTYKINTNGAYAWTNTFPAIPTTVNVGTAIAVDAANNVYITGYSQGTNSSNNIVTIKYDNNGNQLWLESYSGPGNGSAAANAIAVDAGGNVYVTGYETVAGGGTEMVTIKYAPGPFLKKQANGSFLLQAAGAAGESFDFQASTNLQTWQDLGTNTADSTGQVQFLDTNAPLFPHRFYQTNPR